MNVGELNCCWACASCQRTRGVASSFILETEMRRFGGWNFGPWQLTTLIMAVFPQSCKVRRLVGCCVDVRGLAVIGGFMSRF